MTKILDMNTTSTVNISNTSTVTTSNYDMIHEYANEFEVETSIDTTVKDESTGSFLDKVVNWCSDRVEDVVEGAKQVGEAVGEAVKDVAETVKPVGESVVDWCSDRVEDAIDWCSDRKQELTNWWDDVCTDWDKKANGYNFTYDKYIENDYSQFAGILTMESINESLELKNSLLADMYYNDSVISYYENLDYELSLIYPGYATSDWYGLTAEEYAYALYLKDLGTGMGEEWANDPERVKAREEAVNSMVEFMEGYTSQLGYDSYDAFVEDYNKRKEVIAALNEDNYNRQRAMDLIPYQAIYDSEAFQNATVDTKYDYSKSDPFTTLETIEMIENSNHPLYSRYGFNSREEFDEFKILYYMSEEDRKMYFYLKENVPNEATNFLEANVDAANRTAGEIKAVKELSEAGIITLKDDIDTTNVKHPEILMENYEISDQNAFLSYCAGFGLGVKDGVIQWGDGIENFFCNDGIKSVQDYKVQYLSQMLAQATGAKMFLDETYQLGSSIGNMLPTIALGELAGVAYGAQVAQTVSSISMFVSTAGNETERARQNYNCSTFEAYLYGSIIGASEVGLERVLGTISPIANKEATNVLTAFTGEFEEEFVQTYIEAFVQAGMFGEDIDLSTLTADALKSGVMGGLTGSMFYGGNFICTNVNSGVTYIFSSPEQKELINSYKQELANNPDLKLDEFIIQYGEARRAKTSMISDQANQAAIDRMSTDKYSPINKLEDSDVSSPSDLDVADISIDSIDVMGMETDVGINPYEGISSDGQISSIDETLGNNTSIRSEVINDTDPSELANILKYTEAADIEMLISNLSNESLVEAMKTLDNQSIKKIMGSLDADTASDVRKLAAAEIYKNGMIKAQTDYKAFFQNFREHGELHTAAVAEYARDLGRQLGLKEDDLAVVFEGGRLHDLGMEGGLFKGEDGVYHVIDELKRSDKIYAQADDGSYFEVDKLFMENNPERKIFSAFEIDGKPVHFANVNDSTSLVLANLARENHPLNSAIQILQKDLADSNTDGNLVALLALSHSKSTSGILDFSDSGQWIKSIDKLEAAYKAAEPGADVSGLAKLREAIESSMGPDGIVIPGSYFDNLQKQALAIRDGDAMADIVLKDGMLVMQDGTMAKVDHYRLDSYYSTPQYESGKDEAASITDIIYGSDGKQIRVLDNPYSKSVHAGEMNTTFKSTSDGSNYLATITIKDPLNSPASTMDAVFERINEVVTYGNIPNRAVEIVLPVEMKGTQPDKGTPLDKWYNDQLIRLKKESIEKMKNKGAPPADYEKFYREYVNIVYR